MTKTSTRYRPPLPKKRKKEEGKPVLGLFRSFHDQPESEQLSLLQQSPPKSSRQMIKRTENISLTKESSPKSALKTIKRTQSLITVNIFTKSRQSQNGDSCKNSTKDKEKKITTEDFVNLGFQHKPSSIRSYKKSF